MTKKSKDFYLELTVESFDLAMNPIFLEDFRNKYDTTVNRGVDMAIQPLKESLEKGDAEFKAQVDRIICAALALGYAIKIKEQSKGV